MQVLVVDLNMQFQSALHGSEIGLCRPVIFRNSERYRRMLRYCITQYKLLTQDFIDNFSSILPVFNVLLLKIQFFSSHHHK